MGAYLQTRRIKYLLFYLILGTSQIALSDEAPYDVGNAVTIQVPAAVQKQIDMLAPADRKRLEDALNVEQRFLSLFFTGVACDTTSPYWDDIVGGVVATNADEWSDEVCSNIKLRNVSGYQLLSRAITALCPRAVLQDLQFEGGGVSLTYKLTPLGTLIGPEWAAFKTEGAGQDRRFTVAVNHENRVYKITGSKMEESEIYTFSAYDMKSTMKNLERSLHNPRERGNLALVKEKDQRYKRITGYIEQQAAQMCK